MRSLSKKKLSIGYLSTLDKALFYTAQVSDLYPVKVVLCLKFITSQQFQRGSLRVQSSVYILH